MTTTVTFRTVLGNRSGQTPTKLRLSNNRRLFKRTMHLFNIFLLVGTAILAFPTSLPGLPPRSPSTPAYTLNLPSQPLNVTSPLTDDWPTICYWDYQSPAVNSHSCAAMIAYLARRPDALVQRLWLPNAVHQGWTLPGCRVSIITGRWRTTFSLHDVMLKMIKVLDICQPPKHLGIGGSTPIGGTEGLMYAAFHVQVTGVAQ